MNTFYIDKVNVNYLKKYGYFGLYILILKQENIYFEKIDKYSDEVSDEFLVNYINQHIEIFKKKALRIEEFHISGSLIDEKVKSFFDSIQSNQKVLIEGYFENSDMINDICCNDNVFLKDIYVNRLNLDQMKTYIELKNKNKVLKEQYDFESLKKVLVVNNDEDILFNINSSDDCKKLLLIIQNNQISGKFRLNINASDYRMLVFLNNLLYYTESIDVNLNLNMKSIDPNKIPKMNFSEDFSCQVEAYGEHFDDYMEFYVFNNLIKFLNKKIPSNATQLEKTIFISNFIVNYLSYDSLTLGHKSVNFAGERINTSIGDVVYLGDGVCRHYAELTKCLLNYYDIECEYVASDTRELVRYLENDLPIEYDHDGRLINENLIGHAFNLVYLDEKPYWLDLTWADFDSSGIVSDPNFLVSSDTFAKTHYEYVELDNYFCENDYDREKIRQAIYNISNWNVDITLEDINWLTSNGYGVLAQKKDVLNPRTRK